MDNSTDKITRYSDVPDSYYADLSWPRGIFNSPLITRPTDPSKIPPHIYVLKEGMNRDSRDHFIKFDVDLNMESLLTLDAPPIEDPLTKKRERLLKLVSPSFHYLNEKEVDSFYDSMFKSLIHDQEPIIQEIATEITRASKDSIAAEIPKILKASLSGDKIAKYVSKIRFEEASYNQKFLQYQKAMIEQEQVVLGLELKNEKSRELAEFDDLVRRMKAFGVQLTDQHISDTREKLGKKNVDAILQELADSKDRKAIISANFTILEPVDKPQFFMLSYLHPLGKIIDQRIEINVMVEREKIEESWQAQYQAFTGDKIGLTVFGIILRTVEPDVVEGKKETSKITIKPTAIYT